MGQRVRGSMQMGCVPFMLGIPMPLILLALLLQHC